MTLTQQTESVWCGYSKNRNVCYRKITGEIIDCTAERIKLDLPKQITRSEFVSIDTHSHHCWETRETEDRGMGVVYMRYRCGLYEDRGMGVVYLGIEVWVWFI